MGDHSLTVDGPEPVFFSLLTDNDQLGYRRLRSTLGNSDQRYKRNKRIESLQDALDAIREFCIRNDADDWKRCLACGVCWLDRDLAINTRQLGLLVDKCKSSINGALAGMGFGTTTPKSDVAQSLVTRIPYLQGNFVEQRQWTIRRKTGMSPTPIRPVYPIPIIAQTPSPIDFREEDIALFDLAPFDLAPQDQGYNFITDPCCCCPISWAKTDSSVDDVFKFA
jgi:hypothetical protein